jgi:hypothetical protein
MTREINRLSQYDEDPAELNELIYPVQYFRLADPDSSSLKPPRTVIVQSCCYATILGLVYGC